jgi:dTDP-glucose 4,6-dehydratase
VERIVITGVAGFIGSNFARYILEHTKYTILGLDSLTYASNLRSIEDLPSDRFAFEECDIRNQSSLLELMKVGDTVVNFAAESHNDNSLHSPEDFVSTNLVGTFNLLEASRKLGLRFHQISTDEVFGDLTALDPKFNENSPYNPSSPYSASKAGSDHLVRAWVRTYGLKATISNCSNNYGPRQHVEKFIPRQITNLLQGRNAILYGGGTNVRDWIHVDDHSSALLRILQVGNLGETYLIGSNGEKSNREVLGYILESLGKTWDQVDLIDDRPGHDFRYAIDARKLSKRLGWEPKVSNFEEGIRSTIDWYRKNQDWWITSKDSTESKYATQIKAGIAQ